MKQHYTYWSCKMGHQNQIKGLRRMKLRNKWVSDIEEWMVCLWNPFCSHWSVLNGFYISCVFFFLFYFVCFFFFKHLVWQNQVLQLNIDLSLATAIYLLQRKNILQWYPDHRWTHDCSYLIHLLTLVRVPACDFWKLSGQNFWKNALSNISLWKLRY